MKHHQPDDKIGCDGQSRCGVGETPQDDVVDEDLWNEEGIASDHLRDEKEKDPCLDGQPLEEDRMFTIADLEAVTPVQHRCGADEKENCMGKHLKVCIRLPLVDEAEGLELQKYILILFIFLSYSVFIIIILVM